MPTTSEVRRERAIAALEAASRLYEGKDGTSEMYTRSVLNTAENFLRWLEDKA